MISFNSINNVLFTLVQKPMQKHFLKFRGVFTNIACTPLILVSNNSELAAKYLPSDANQSIKKLEINNGSQKIQTPSNCGFIRGLK